MEEYQNEKRIADALERIANSLDMLAQKPAWVKQQEKVVQAGLSVVEEAPKVEKKLTDSEKQKPLPKTAKNDLLNKTVKVVKGDHTGKTGVVTEIMRAWVYLKTDDNPRLAVRPMNLEVIGDETGEPPQNEDEKEDIEKLNALIEEVDNSTAPKESDLEKVGLEPSDDPQDHSNFIISSGKHAGKTLHSLYHESGIGSKTVKWFARSGSNEELKNAAQGYLESIGEGWLE